MYVFWWELEPWQWLNLTTVEMSIQSLLAWLHNHLDLVFWFRDWGFTFYPFLRQQEHGVPLLSLKKEWPFYFHLGRKMIAAMLLFFWVREFKGPDSAVLGYSSLTRIDFTGKSLRAEFMPNYTPGFKIWYILCNVLRQSAFKYTLSCPLFSQQLLLVTSIKTNSEVWK